MFCAPGLIFGGAEGIGSNFHVLRSRTRFRRFRGSRVPFSNFARPCSFSMVPRGSGPVFMFCAPGLVFGSNERVGSRSRFPRYRGRQDPFSSSALPNSFSAVLRATGPIFMFCAPVLIFGCTEGVGSHFHVLHARTHFRRCGGRRVPFSCFALVYH
jgi:hypothetical protein